MRWYSAFIGLLNNEPINNISSKEFLYDLDIYIIKNKEGITAEKLSGILKRNDIKKSEVYDSDFLGGTVPTYESYIALKKR